MTNQTLLVIAMILSFVAVAAALLWRAIYSTKHKGDEKAMDVITKAQAWSSWTVLYAFLIWECAATFVVGRDYKFTVGNVGMVIMFIWGLQSLSELGAAYCFINMDNKRA